MRFFKTIINKNLIGSTICLVFGLITAVGAATNPNRTSMFSYALPGLYIIAGALAYQSAKKRRLGLVKTVWWRKYLEFLLLASIVVVLFRTQEILRFLQDGDMTNIVIVSWAIIAYLFAIARRKKVEWAKPSIVQKEATSYSRPV